MRGRRDAGTVLLLAHHLDHDDGGPRHIPGRMRGQGMADAYADALSSAEVSAVIVRACTRCSGPRTERERCATCGNRKPPEVTRLGVVSATHKRWWRRWWWTVMQKPRADRRIRGAARRTEELRHSGP